MIKQNCSANHRGNDVIVGEGLEQVVTAKFSYGPLDVVALTGKQIFASHNWFSTVVFHWVRNNK
jgi:hypothetical protein